MMKNITLAADDVLIEQARERARLQETTLNAVFRQWLAAYVAERGARETYEALLARLDHVEAGRPYSRDEMNER